MTGSYNKIGEYFLKLVQQDKKCQAQAKLEMLLLEGINSDTQEVTPEYWQNLRFAVLGENSTATQSSVAFALSISTKFPQNFHKSRELCDN